MTPSAPGRLVPPPDSCDCHIHIFDPAAPLAAPGSPPLWATTAAYQAMRDRLGVTRTVVVQASGYRTDNSVLVGALASLGPNARGVAAVDQTVTDEELERLTKAGVRGARFHMLPGGFLSWEDLHPVAARVAAFGWHIQLQMDGRFLHERLTELQWLPTTLVIDHVGKFLEPAPADHPGFQALLQLLETGRCWLKLSAPYEVSKVGPPDYRDVGALAKIAADAAPDRMLWASNWPHASLKEGLPDDAALLDLLRDWVPDDRRRHAVLVENPSELYGFPTSSSASPIPAASER